MIVNSGGAPVVSVSKFSIGNLEVGLHSRVTTDISGVELVPLEGICNDFFINAQESGNARIF